MTTEQTQFVLLANEYEHASDELNKLRERLVEAMTKVGVGNYAQDLNTGAVYKVVKPNGTFIYYREIDYKRTALGDEKGGQPLSKKEAQEAIEKGLV
jgi:hypothetical protein